MLLYVAAWHSQFCSWHFHAPPLQAGERLGFQNHTTSLHSKDLTYLFVVCELAGRVHQADVLCWAPSSLIRLFTIPSYGQVVLLAAVWGTLQLCLFSIPPCLSDTELINQLLVPVFFPERRRHNFSGAWFMLWFKLSQKLNTTQLLTPCLVSRGMGRRIRKNVKTSGLR